MCVFPVELFSRIDRALCVLNCIILITILNSGKNVVTTNIVYYTRNNIILL